MFMEEEISLRELIEMLLKWKRLIILITVGAVIISALVSWFVLPEVYTASATMKISPPLTIRVPVVDSKDFSGDDKVIIMDSSSFRELAITREVTLEEIKLQITNPEFIEEVSQRIGKDISGAQISVEPMPTEKQTQEVPDHIYLQLEVSMGDPKTAATAVNAIAAELPNHLERVSNEERQKKNEVLLNQINEVEKQINEAEAIRVNGSETEARKAEARAASLMDIYTGLLMKYEEEQVLSSIETPGENPSLVSPAVEPAAPVKPKKIQNIAIAFILGLMAGVFLAFFLEYWRDTSTGDEDKISLEQNES